MDPDGPRQTRADSGGPGWTRMDLDGPGWTQTVQESSGLVKIRLLILYSESYTIIGDFCPKPFGLFIYKCLYVAIIYVHFVEVNIAIVEINYGHQKIGF